MEDYLLVNTSIGILPGKCSWWISIAMKLSTVSAVVSVPIISLQLEREKEEGMLNNGHRLAEQNVMDQWLK